jgi:hypothetical protein
LERRKSGGGNVVGKECPLILPHCKSGKIKFQTYNLKTISVNLYFKIYVCILVSHVLLKVQKNS